MASSLKDKIKGHKTKFLIYSIVDYMCIILPFVIVCIVNRDEYFTTKNDAVSLSIGCLFGAIVLILCIAGKTKFLTKSRGLGWMIVITLLMYLFKMVLQDMTLIMTVSLCGFVVSLFFHAKAVKHKAIYDDYIKSIRNKEVMVSGEQLELDENGRIK